MGNCEVHIEHTNDRSNNSTSTAPIFLFDEVFVNPDYQWIWNRLTNPYPILVSKFWIQLYKDVFLILTFVTFFFWFK